MTEPIDADMIAREIADRLKVRDDIASAKVDADDPTLVIVRTQGGKPFLIYVERDLSQSDG